MPFRDRFTPPFTLALLTLCLLSASGVPGAVAAGPPAVGEPWSASVQATSAKLQGTVDPQGLSTGYRFEYIDLATYEANVDGGKDPFAGTLRSPPLNNANVGSGNDAVPVSQTLFGLGPDTAYRYRLVAQSMGGTTTSGTAAFRTYPPGGGPVLADGRGWELVSPLEKNGGEVAAPEAVAAGGVLQAAAGGDAVTYSSATSFGADAQGAPAGSQYVATRGSGGWLTANITTPQVSGSYGTGPVGVPYQLFSTDLARSLLLNGRHCRGEAIGCPVANPPLPGSGAPAGYQNYYLRQGAAFTALLTEPPPLSASWFDLTLVGTSSDLRHAALSSCAALTPGAVEVASGDGCDPAAPNLYLWSDGNLAQVNIPGPETPGTPFGRIAAPAGAVSEDGSRAYWQETATGALQLYEAGVPTRRVDTDASADGTFQAASADGSVAYFTAPQLGSGDHLFRFEVATGDAEDITPGGGVAGVLGASRDGCRVYYQDASGLRLWTPTGTVQVAPGPVAAAPGNYPPATGSARVSADGLRLLFVSGAALTGYDNTDLANGEPDSQVFLYGAGSPPSLTCVSCNPTGMRPIGPSTIPGASANGALPESVQAYKPRVLSADGRRAFFDSRDALVLNDRNADADVYQWEAQGKGSCTRSGGCVSLISSGRGESGARFADASEDGSDVFFLTDEPLVPADAESVDLYDARIGGGFPEPSPPIGCEGDSCQPLPSAPTDPTLTTLLAGPGNPPEKYQRAKKRRRHAKKKQQRRKGAKQRQARRHQHRVAISR